MTDLFHRVRWTNLARALAVLVALVLAVLALRGKDREPALPAPLAEPPATVAEGDEGAADPAAGGDEALDEAGAEDAAREAEARAERSEARRAAAKRKAARRRATKRAAARRAAERRRTAARKRAAAQAAVQAGRPTVGVAGATRPRLSPPPSPGGEFRP